MKMLLLIYDVTFDDDVMEALAACGAEAWTKWERCLGRGQRSPARLGDAVWPGFNCALMMMVAEDEERRVREALEAVYQQMGQKALRLFAWEAQGLI